MKAFTLISLCFLLTSFTIFAIESTKVKVIVVNEHDALIEGAHVSLYNTHERYKQEKNASASGVTNSKGFVQFKKLEERVYFILVRKGSLNNNGGNNQTDTLHADSKNRFQIMID